MISQHLQPVVNLRDAAQAFLAEHLDDHLAGERERLVHRCIEHLMGCAEISTQTAEDIALQVLAELTCRGQRCYIDLSRSTGQVVFLRDPERKTSVVFTVPDLLRLSRLAQRGAA